MPQVLFRTALVLLAGLAFEGAPASAQSPPPFVARSTTPAPALVDPAVLRQQRVEVASPAVLHEAAPSRVLVLDLFGDLRVRAVRRRIEPTPQGWTWTGVLEGYPDSTAVFSAVGDELTGHIYAPFGFIRIERQRDGSYLAQQVDPLASQEGSDAVMPPPEPADADASPRSEAASTDDGSVIDVAIAYTSDALGGFGGELRALVGIHLAVAEVNQAFQNSRLGARVRLVHAGLTYPETGNGLLDLSRLERANDGFLDDLLRRREQYGADLVALVVERSDVCGRGWVNSPAHRRNGEYGFSLVARNCLRGGRVLGHEIGHNLGANHDWYVTAAGGAFPYSKGHVNVAGRFLDLMAYGNLCAATRTQCTQLLAYANPRVMQDGHPTGIPTGTGMGCTPGDTSRVMCDADVAHTFTTMFQVVARYRQSRADLTPRHLLAGDALLPGGAARSASGRYRLAYQSDGNLVLYDDSERLVLWASNTVGTRPGRAVMQADGNLVVYDQGGRPIWSSGTVGHSNAFLVLQDDGNLVVYGADGTPIWGSRL